MAKFTNGIPESKFSMLSGSSMNEIIDDGIVSGNAIIDRVSVSWKTILKYLTFGSSAFTVPKGVTSVHSICICGGGETSSSSATGGNGGSGIVIVRFATQSRTYNLLMAFADNASAKNRRFNSW